MSHDSVGQDLAYNNRRIGRIARSLLDELGFAQAINDLPFGDAAILELVGCMNADKVPLIIDGFLDPSMNPRP